LSPDGKSLVSGGADSQIVVWSDTTVQEEQAKRAEEEEQILMDQKLANHLRHKEYKQALEITLARDKPHQALKVLIAIIETDVQKTGGTGLEPLQQHAKGWTPERLARILSYCREWNTRALNSHVALLVVQAVVTCIPIHKLVVIDGVPEIMAGIMPYAERHFDRLDKLYTSSYLLDFALSNMGSLEADDDLNAQAEFATWESSSKLVLPPKLLDGRVQIGGMAVVGAARNKQSGGALNDDDDDDEVMTVGDSDSSVDGESDSDSRNSGRVDAVDAVSDQGSESGSD
jgi:Utp13 specific WD40 associated domain